MTGTPFYYTINNNYSVTAADVANGSFALDFPIFDQISVAPFYYLWAVHGNVRRLTVGELPLDETRIVWAFSSLDFTAANAGPFPFYLTGSNHDFYNYVRFKPIDSSFLCQVIVVIGNNPTPIIAGNLMFYSLTVTFTFDAPAGQQGSPGQKKKESIHTGAIEQSLQPGKFRFDH